jgi:hypothetical protein
MKRTAIVMAVLLGFATTAIAGDLTHREQEIYYSALEEVFSIPDNPSEELLDGEYPSTQAKFGVSTKKVDDIMNKATSRPATDRERMIAEEVSRRMNALSGSVRQADTDRVFNEIARKYNLEIHQLYDIALRGWQKQ